MKKAIFILFAALASLSAAAVIGPKKLIITGPDRALLNVAGPVKTVATIVEPPVGDGEVEFYTFTPSGYFTDESLEEYSERNSMGANQVRRNANGYIIGLDVDINFWKDGRLAESIDTFEMWTYYTYHYDTNGYLTKKIIDAGMPEKVSTKYRYFEFDNYGNWTKAVVNDGWKGETALITRALTYYPADVDMTDDVHVEEPQFDVIVASFSDKWRARDWVYENWDNFWVDNNLSIDLIPFGNILRVSAGCAPTRAEAVKIQNIVKQRYPDAWILSPAAH